MEALISTQTRWERSTDTGSTNEYGETGRILSQGRTSSNSWCQHECESHPSVQSAIAKIEEVTMVPRENYESFQVLRYELGQKYVTHHDYGSEEKALACGPRILTFFLYLSDVEEGGETNFPELGISVKPRKGGALLWPSTLSHGTPPYPAPLTLHLTLSRRLRSTADVQEIDSRTVHEARPVVRGTKYAANSWIHLYDFVTPNLWGCTGTFDEL